MSSTPETNQTPETTEPYVVPEGTTLERAMLLYDLSGLGIACEEVLAGIGQARPGVIARHRQRREALTAKFPQLLGRK